MPKTLHESFHEMIKSVRSLNIAAVEISSEFSGGGVISDQKLRRLLAINAKAIQVLAVEKSKTGMGTYSKDELGSSFNVAAVTTATESAMTIFKDFMIANMPTPLNNGLDANGNSSLLTVTNAQMPELLTEVNNLIAGTDWA